jgi:pimeloyl-ACP methyl ester carboxylesterase
MIEQVTIGTVRSADGTTIAFNRAGDGPPVILVGGALNDRSFPPLVELGSLLSSSFTVYTHDRRGRGDSGDTTPYAVVREVEDLEALISEAGGPAFVYGLSSGAILALEAAADGVAIAKLALFEPPVTLEDDPGSDVDVQIAELISNGRRGEAVELFVKGIGIPAETIAEMRGSPQWPAWEAMAPTLLYEFALTEDRSLVTRLGSVSVPTLVINSEASGPFFDQAARVVAEALPGGERRTVDGQYHDVAAEDLAAVLAGFFAS